ncbi:MAG: SpaH/EbpB family LPXTG-anchored major pilin [Lachnospiraceae bacterium]|nr:SpaH/EbpB family LPXTG-anchored major pilin [Lachnospiraceae bacterium]
MSKMKKLASVLLALVMALAMTCTAFAANITITGAQSGHTYTAYQIFTGTLNADGDTLSDVVWGSDVTNSTSLLAALVADDTIGSYFTTSMTAAQVAEVVAGWRDDSVNLNAFAAVVAQYVDSTSGTVLDSSEASDGTYTHSATGLDDGYYLVVDTATNLADGDAISRYIIQVISDVTIETKTGTTTFEKDADDVSVEVGQTVTFTLTSTVPDTTYYTTYTWSVSDTMSDGLTFDGTSSIIVSIGGTTVTNYTAKATENGFNLSIDMTQYQDYVGQTVTITYTATVNENAVSVVSENNATLTYSNNPNDSDSTDTITDKTEVYSAKVVIDKVDGETDEKLSGAKFVLYKYDEDGTTKLYYKYTADDESTDEDESAVSWVENITDATEVTTVNGAASFIGLEDGTYYLHETEAPDGYNTLTTDTEVTIAGSTTNVGTLTVTAEIANESGSTLPSTGGIGTTIFYIVGGVMVLGAAVLLITRRCMSTR